MAVGVPGAGKAGPGKAGAKPFRSPTAGDGEAYVACLEKKATGERKPEPRPLGEARSPQASPELRGFIHHGPLCVPAPAPEAPQPAALSSLIGSAVRLRDWLSSGASLPSPRS